MELGWIGRWGKNIYNPSFKLWIEFHRWYGSAELLVGSRNLWMKDLDTDCRCVVDCYYSTNNSCNLNPDSPAGNWHPVDQQARLIFPPLSPSLTLTWYHQIHSMPCHVEGMYEGGQLSSCPSGRHLTDHNQGCVINSSILSLLMQQWARMGTICKPLLDALYWQIGCMVDLCREGLLH